MAAPPPPSAQPGWPRRLWRSFNDLSSRTPLRIKLIAALLALVTAGLAVASTIGIFVLRSYLGNRADREVTSVYEQYKQAMQSGQLPGAQAGRLANGLGGFPTAAQLRDSHGNLVLGGGGTVKPTSGPRIPTSKAWLAANAGHLVTVGAINSTDRWRVITQSITVQRFDPLTGTNMNLPYTLVIGVDLGDIGQTIGRLISIDVIVGAVVVLGMGVLGVAAVRTSMQPLAEMERTASEIAGGDLSRRVPGGDPGTEVGSLGRSLNIMLARIESAFQAQAQSEAAARQSENRMRQFAADASHELRTPLTAIKGYAEYYRQRGGLAAGGDGELNPEDLNRIMTRVEDEATRMGVLVEDLLLLARVDQQRPLEQSPVDLLAIAADTVQDARMIAPDREIKLEVGHDTAFLVIGDEARLRQVAGNLMTNALTHTPAGTPVELGVHAGTLGWSAAPGRAGPVGLAGPTAGPPSTPAVVLEVTDHGPGMPAEQARHVFERFYRADQARTRATGGNGLGLAIVAALVMAHGGTVSVDTAPGRGATFRVALPLDPQAQGVAGEDDDDFSGLADPAGPWMVAGQGAAREGSGDQAGVGAATGTAGTATDAAGTDGAQEQGGGMRWFGPGSPPPPPPPPTPGVASRFWPGARTRTAAAPAAPGEAGAGESGTGETRGGAAAVTEAEPADAVGSEAGQPDPVSELSAVVERRSWWGSKR